MKIRKQYCTPAIRVREVVPPRILDVSGTGQDMPWGAKQSSDFFEVISDNEDEKNNTSEYIIDFNYE